MKKAKAFNWKENEATLMLTLAAVTIIIIVLYASFVGLAKQEDYSKTCSTDEDCIAAGACCHPQECLSKEGAQKFKEENCGDEYMCTAVVGPTPICECIDSVCTKTGMNPIPW